MRPLAGDLFCSYHRRISGRTHPLVVIRAVDFRLATFGQARIVSIDPHGAFAADALGREMLDRVRYLLGERYSSYSSLESACNTVHRACTGEPTAAIDYRTELRCYIVLQEGAAVALDAALAEAGPTPQLATLGVHVLQADRLGSVDQRGTWIALGQGCPWVPPGMSDDDARAEAGHVSSTPVGAQKRRRGKKTGNVVVGKTFFFDEEVAGRDAREPHVVERLDKTAQGVPPPGIEPFSLGNGDCAKWASTRSLAKDSVRVLPATLLVPLERYFVDRVQEHLDEGHLRGELCPACAALVRAVQIESERNDPPMTFASVWKWYAPEVPPPPLPDGTIAAVASKRAHDADEPEAATDGQRRVAARRGVERPAGDEEAGQAAPAAAAALPALAPGVAAWHGTELSGGVAVRVRAVHGDGSRCTVTPLAGGDAYIVERELLWEPDGDGPRSLKAWAAAAAPEGGSRVAA